MSKHSYFAYLEKAEALGRLTEITLKNYSREVTTAKGRDGSCLIIYSYDNWIELFDIAEGCHYYD